MSDLRDVLILFELEVSDCLFHLFRFDLLVVVDGIEVVIFVSSIVILHDGICLLLLGFPHFIHQCLVLYFEAARDLTELVHFLNAIL